MPTNDLSKEELLNKIEELENENCLLKEGVTSFLTTGETVSVPEQFKPLFDVAQKTVGSYFQELKASPSKGTIEINDERYVLLRASALSIDFLNKIKDLYADKGEEQGYAIGRNFLFDIAHLIGMEDAKSFHKKMNLEDPIAKLSAGPVHFAYSGWAYVDILPESNPSPDENYFLKYNHPFSFEADSWIKKGVKSDFPVCIMNSGYSSGWCEESFGLSLTAVEITCRAKGDENCTFIMAPPHKIEGYLKEEDLWSDTEQVYEVPSFFERKNVEEKLKSSLHEKETLLKEIHHRVKNNLQIISSLLNLQSHFIKDEVTEKVFAETKTRIKTLALVHEKLYQSQDLKEIKLDEYIHSIVDLLTVSYFKPEKRVVIKVDCESLTRFDIDQATPLGLIINELVSNSFKHAFANQNKGEVLIQFRNNEGNCALLIEDNGQGLPEGFSIENSGSLGLEIVASLADQLGGTLSASSDGTTKIEVKFSINKL